MQDWTFGIRKQKIEGRKYCMYQNHGMNSVHVATGLTVEPFNNLLEFLNPCKDSCNITFYDTSSRLS